MLTFGGGDIDGFFRHPLDELDLKVFFAGHRGDVDVGGVSLFAVDGEGFQHILEAHAVVGFFPHLLGEVEVRLGSVDVGVDTECEGLVDQQLAGVEVAHQEGNGVTFFIRHLLEVCDVLAQLNFVGEPGVGNSLVVEVHGPLVFHGLEKKSFLYALSENAHYVLLSSC